MHNQDEFPDISNSALMVQPLKVGYDTKDKGDQTIEIYNDQKITLGKIFVTTRQKDVQVSRVTGTMRYNMGLLFDAYRDGTPAKHIEPANR